jgi:hypothetical protein
VDTDHTDQPTAVIIDGRRVLVDAILDHWRIDDEWWRCEVSRRYVNVVLAHGKRMVLFCDLVDGRWYCHRA